MALVTLQVANVLLNVDIDFMTQIIQNPEKYVQEYLEIMFVLTKHGYNEHELIILLVKVANIV